MTPAKAFSIAIIIAVTSICAITTPALARGQGASCRDSTPSSMADGNEDDNSGSFSSSRSCGR